MAQINKPTNYFNTVTWTGDGVNGRTITTGHNTNFIWGKERSNVNSNWLVDIVRGAGKRLRSDTTNLEDNIGQPNFVTNGFTVPSTVSLNGSGRTFVGWSWLAGGTAVSNTDGSITSSVSANTTSGFSIVSWTGNSGTVGHGLGVKPACIIVKSRQSVNNWVVMHQGLTGGMSTNVLVLNSTSAQGGGGAGMAEPTSDVFTITSGLASNDNNIGYVFAEKKGFSKFGKYTGNGSATNGTFVYTGFKPSFVLTKQTNTTGFWILKDNKRPSYQNPNDTNIYPNTSDAEATPSANDVDFLSNGFKIRNTGSYQNTSGGSYIYMAFAENPLVGTNNIPTTAR